MNRFLAATGIATLLGSGSHHEGTALDRHHDKRHAVYRVLIILRFIGVSYRLQFTAAEQIVDQGRDIGNAHGGISINIGYRRVFYCVARQQIINKFREVGDIHVAVIIHVSTQVGRRHIERQRQHQHQYQPSYLISYKVSHPISICLINSDILLCAACIIAIGGHLDVHTIKRGVTRVSPQVIVAHPGVTTGSG